MAVRALALHFASEEDLHRRLVAPDLLPCRSGPAANSWQRELDSLPKPRCCRPIRACLPPIRSSPCRFIILQTKSSPARARLPLHQQLPRSRPSLPKPQARLQCLCRPQPTPSEARQAGGHTCPRQSSLTPVQELVQAPGCCRPPSRICDAASRRRGIGCQI